MNRFSARRLTFLAAVTLGAGGLAVNCSKTDKSSDDVGTIKMALSLPGGVTVPSVSYRILSAGGMPLVTGTINTSDPNATASVDTSCPASTGDTLEMTATTSAGVQCKGTSAAFNVSAGGSVMVGVTLICGGGPTMTGSGSVIGMGTFVDGNYCPVLNTWMASPLQTSARGGRVDVSAAATDMNTTETLTYAWTASPSGTFVAPGSATTQYVCDAPGAQTLTVTVTDSHSPPCSVTMTFPVTCVAVMGQGGAGGAGGMGQGGMGQGGMGQGGMGQGGMGQGGMGQGGMGQGGMGQGGMGQGGMGQGGAGGTALCVACEQKVPFVDACTPDLLRRPNQTMWGCDGFPEPARTNCLNLLSCVRGNGPQGRCVGSPAPGLPADDPTPCLCGTLDANTCVTSGAPASAPCAAQYAAAVVGFPGTVFTQFNDPTTPVGIADNLVTCDVDQPCSMQCGLQ